jgi:sodium/potassium-transporting ATPase subunit alpha
VLVRSLITLIVCKSLLILLNLDLADLEWHTITVEELTRRLSVTLNQGLSPEQASRRIIEHGKNKMTAPPSGLFGKITGYFFGGFGSILLVACVLVFIAWRPLGNPPAIANLALAIVLMVVFFFQAGFNAWQDWSSSRVMASIGTMLPDQCLVVRDGGQITISAQDMVPGDLVVIKQGNKLPADVRFVEVSSDAMFDRAILTGTFFPFFFLIESRQRTPYLGLA